MSQMTVSNAYVVANAELKPSMSTDALMRNSSFKQELCQFLQTERAMVEFRSSIGQKKLCASHGGTCICKEGHSDTVSRPDHYQGDHEEADTLVAFHAAQCKGDVVVRGTDTDILIILLGMLGKHYEYCGWQYI